MKNLVKSVVVAIVAIISFAGSNEAKAQLHIEAIVNSPCNYHVAQIFWGYGPGTCSIVVDEYVKVVYGDNFYFPPAPGMVAKAVEIIDNGNGNGALVSWPNSCMTQDNFFQDCSNGPMSAYMTSNYYIAIF